MTDKAQTIKVVATLGPDLEERLNALDKTLTAIAAKVGAKPAAKATKPAADKKKPKAEFDDTDGDDAGDDDDNDAGDDDDNDAGDDDDNDAGDDDDDAGPSADDVAKAMRGYAKLSSQSAAMKLLLQHGGVKALSALKPAKFQMVIDACKKATVKAKKAKAAAEADD